MKITFDLATDESIALRRLANEVGPTDLNEAAAYALREYLITVGYLELPESDNDNEGE